MKKLVFFVLMFTLILSVSLSATVRSYYQEINCELPNNINTYVTNTSTSSTSPNYLFEAWTSADGYVKHLFTGTGGTPATSLRIFTLTGAGPRAYVQMSAFTAITINAGAIIRCRLTYLGAKVANPVEWDFVVPTGTAAIYNDLVHGGYSVTVPPTPTGPSHNYPTLANEPIPADHTTNVPVTTTQISWSHTDNADYTTATGYKVYFGKDALPSTYTYVTAKNMTVSVVYGGHYYWKVVPTDASSKGIIPSNQRTNATFRGDNPDAVEWDFTVETNPNPGLATNPTPANNALNVPIATTNISWNYTSDPSFTDPIGYKVYFGTNSDVTSNPMTFITGMLNTTMPVTLGYATNYFWKVIPTTISGAKAGGTVTTRIKNHTRGDAEGASTWYFRTESFPVSPNPGIATNPVPVNGAVNVAHGTTSLLWTYTIDPLFTNPVGYKVYLHTNNTFTENALAVPYLYVSGISNTQVTLPITLAYDTHYYWKVIPTTEMSKGDAVNATIWDFTTESLTSNVPNPAVISAPLNAGTDVLINAQLAWVNGGGGTTGYKIYLGTNNPPTNIVNGTDLGLVDSYTPISNFVYSTIYYWQVVPYNTYGNAENCPIWSFTTMGDPTITSFPYVQGFEGANFPPLGWNMSGWLRGTGSHTGSYSARALKNHSGVSILSTPSVVLTENKYISFWWKDDDVSRVAGHDSTYFEISNNSGSTWIKLATLSPTNPDIQYHEYSTSLSAYSGQTVQFRWRDVTDGSANAYGVGLDDITIGTFVFAPPQNLTATPGYGVIGLAWQAPLGRSLTTYKVYRNSVFLASTPPGTYTYNDNTVVNNVTYTYYVTADYTSPTFESVPSNTVQSTPLIPVFNPVTTFSASLTTYNSITLQWTLQVAKHNRSISGFKIYRNSTLAATLTNPTTTSWIDTNLASGSYSYYIVCTYSNPNGESIPSSTQTVNVPVPVLNPPTNLAGTTTYNSVSLTWTAPTGSTATLTNYKIYKGDNLLATLSAVNVSYTDNAVTSGTSYTYYVKAVYTAPVGESVPSNSVILTPPLPVFHAPTNLVGVAGNASVALTWTAPAAGSTGTLAMYRLYRNTVFLTSVSATNTAYTDNTVTNGTEYTYYVQATYTGPTGTSAGSNSVIVTPFQPIFNPPSNLTAIAGNATVALAWSAPAAGSQGTLTNYKLYRNATLLVTLESTVVAYTDNAVINGTAYTYYVKAAYTNLTGDSDQSNTATATPLLPVYNPPTNLTAVAGNATVALAWSAPAAGSTGTLTNYKLYRNSTLLITLPVTGVTYTDNAVINGTAYTYYAIAVYTNWDGESVQSNTVTATPLLPLYNPPTNLTAVAGNATVTLAWTAPAAGSTGTLTNYKLYRNSTLLITLPVTGVTYTDNAVTNGTAYTYYITAVYTNWDGESAHSNTAAATPLLPVYNPPANLTAVAGNATVALAWTAPAAGSTGTLTNYKLYRNSTLLITLPVTGVTYTDNAVTNGTAYTYYVTAVYTNWDGESAHSNTAAATPLLPVYNPPTNLTAVAGNATVALAWTAPAAGSTGTLTNYKLYRNSTLLITLPVTGVTYTDNAVTNGTAYSYYVKAVYTNWDGESSSSNTVTVTPVVPVYNPPTNLTVNVQQAIATLNWVAPTPAAGTTLTGYKVYRNNAVVHTITGTTTTWSETLPAGVYNYKVTATYVGNESPASNEVGITVANSDPIAVLATNLKGCYPNPFNPTTTIAYSVKTPNHVMIEIYSVKGQKVKTLVNCLQNTGNYTVVWNGADDFGKTMSSGIYFYRMVSGNYTDTKKMIMVK